MSIALSMVVGPLSARLRFRGAKDRNEVIEHLCEMNACNHKKLKKIFKELGQNHARKGCEYAVLVSLLEPDNRLYDSSFINVSHRYPKCTRCGHSSSSL